MAKTKLLADIATQTDAVMKLLIDLAGKLGSAAALDDSHWTAYNKIKTEMDKLDQTVSKLEARIKSWDGSAKLRDIFKKKADLAKAREAAKQKVVSVRADVKGVHDSLQEVIEMMQAISRSAH